MTVKFTVSIEDTTSRELMREFSAELNNLVSGFFNTARVECDSPDVPEKYTTEGPGIPATWPASVALPGVVSEGTLNPKHLVPLYAGLLEKIDYTQYRTSRSWCSACLDAIQKGEHHSFGLQDLEELTNVMVALADALDEAAPEGYYFGSIEGDGACIGFFEVSDEDEYPSEGDVVGRREADGSMSISEVTLCPKCRTAFVGEVTPHPCVEAVSCTRCLESGVGVCDEHI